MGLEVLVEVLVAVPLVLELDMSSYFTQHWTLSSPGHGQSG